MKIMQCGSVMIVVVVKQRMRIQSGSHLCLGISKNDFAKKKTIGRYTRSKSILTLL